MVQPCFPSHEGFSFSFSSEIRMNSRYFINCDITILFFLRIQQHLINIASLSCEVKIITLRISSIGFVQTIANGPTIENIETRSVTFDLIPIFSFSLFLLSHLTFFLPLPAFSLAYSFRKVEKSKLFEGRRLIQHEHCRDKEKVKPERES